MSQHCFKVVTFALVIFSATTAVADENSDSNSPFEEVERHRIESGNGVVAADEHFSSEAGAAILAAGGNAADAGVVTLLTLGVTHPFSSGLGGGGFCLYRPVESGQTTVLDFRETAPGEAHRDLYIVDGEADHELARHGGLAIGTPGEAAGVWALHGRFGQLEWEEVVEPARRLADQGFPVGPTLARHLDSLSETLEQWPRLAAVFKDEDGEFLQEGDLMVRDDLVRTLKILRDEGVHPFFAGEIAEAMAETAQEYGGILSTDDLASYAMIPREAVVGEFAGHQIHSMPPPSSGGIALIQALNILENFEVTKDAAYMHLIVEALKHAFADRAHWLGDTDFVDVPVEKLISQEYAAELAARIDPQGVLETSEYGTVAPDVEHPGTSHLSIVDGDGNMLACTTTLNTRFGSLVYVPHFGIILNNEMADFSIEPGEPNIYGLVGNEQNAVEAGKRPLSSMSPTLVTKDGEPLMSLGGSGGPTIISGTYFMLIRTLLFGAEPLEAITAPRLHHQWLPETLYIESDDLDEAEALRELGHDLEVRRSYNATQIILRSEDRWIGVSDPRKGGIPAAPQSTSDRQ